MARKYFKKLGKLRVTLICSAVDKACLGIARAQFGERANALAGLSANDDDSVCGLCEPCRHCGNLVSSGRASQSPIGVKAATISAQAAIAASTVAHFDLRSSAQPVAIATIRTRTFVAAGVNEYAFEMR